MGQIEGLNAMIFFANQKTALKGAILNSLYFYLIKAMIRRTVDEIKENQNMAAIERKRELTERDGVLGVIISRDEYREYVELQQKRDRSENSLRAQMRLQNQAALNLSRMILKMFEKAGYENLSALAGNVVQDIYDLANEILATE